MATLTTQHYDHDHDHSYNHIQDEDRDQDQDSDHDHLTALPHELQLQIISHLPYPDILGLKLTSKHFRSLTQQSLTVVARVTWLLARAQSNLPIPKTGQLRLHNDTVFLRNREIQRMLVERRRHEECAKAWRELDAGQEWPGCLVVPEMRLCEKGVEVLERSGGTVPVWTGNGHMVYVSERMMREWEVRRKRKVLDEFRSWGREMLVEARRLNTKLSWVIMNVLIGLVLAALVMVLVSWRKFDELPTVAMLT